MEEIEKIQQEQSFEINNELKQLLISFYKKKPFIEAADIIHYLMKPILQTQEINIILNSLGQYPYEDVEKLFMLFQSSVTAVTQENK